MKHIPDDILIKALELQEKGKTPEQIFAAFPEAAGELKQYFSLAADLRAEALKIVPPSREVLHNALRRAAAMGEISARSAKPASAKFLDRLPFGMRLLTPALVVLFLVVLIDHSKVITPGPVQIPGDQAADPAAQTGEAFLSPQQNDAASQSQPSQTLTREMPSPAIPPSSGQTLSAPAPMTMMAKDPAFDNSAPQSPASSADRIASIFVLNAEGEEAAFAATSGTEGSTASSGNETGAPGVQSRCIDVLAEMWERQDTEMLAARQNASDAKLAEFDRLEGYLAEASEDKKKAFTAFKDGMDDAFRNRQLAVDVANNNFRGDLKNALQSSSSELTGADCSSGLASPALQEDPDTRKLISQYQADIRSITADFKIRVGSLQAAFKGALDE